MEDPERSCCVRRPRKRRLTRPGPSRARSLRVASRTGSSAKTNAAVARRDLRLDVVPEDVGSSGPPWRLSAVSAAQAPRRHRMDLHGDAAPGWSGRRELARRAVDQGWTLKAAA